MSKRLTYLLVAIACSAGVAAQDKKGATVADYVGTWNIELMSHQVALVIEAAEGNKVTATMMMMGNDLPLKGELADGRLTLVGVKSEGATGAAKVGGGPPQHGADAAGHQPPARPITAQLQEDGTLAGEMMTNQGAAKWTGERLKKRKQ
jgi:hypothetical protein